VRTDRGLDRFITFLDAVVAIAITLLVLPLTEVLTGGHLPAHVADVFTDNASRFGAFLISFAVIARLWLAHHRMVERVGGYDAAFVWVNLAWVLTIVFLPFATQLTAAYPAHDRLAIGTYMGTLTLSSLFLTLAAVLVWRRPGLRREGVTAQQAAPWVALLTSGVLLLALALGTAVPRINYYALLLLFLTGPLERLLPDQKGSEPLDPDGDEG
jgi:TMEM175 potassium channel family protein